MSEIPARNRDRASPQDVDWPSECRCATTERCPVHDMGTRAWEKPDEERRVCHKLPFSFFSGRV
jgi:hypothetical protein